MSGEGGGRGWMVRLDGEAGCVGSIQDLLQAVKGSDPAALSRHHSWPHGVRNDSSKGRGLH